MRTYDIDCKCQIVLYGFNNYTQKQISEIKEQGYFCGGIIDRRAQEIKMYQDIPVVSDIRELRQSKDACVFIMLQNALNHMEVAETLYRQGIKKILFVPMKCNAASQKIRIQLIEKYNMMQGCQYNLLRKIPYVQADFFEKNREPVCRVAKEEADQVIAWVSAEKIFTTIREPAGYADIPLASFTPYIQLFSYLAGKENTDITEYVSLFGISSLIGNARKMEIVGKRKQLFDCFEREINQGMDFFVASAPQAEWNPKGYLNLCEGQHRYVYLLNKGLRKIPVRIKRITEEKMNELYKDYEWENEYFKYMIGMQRYLGRNQLEGYRYVCSEDVPKTIQENLRFCRGNVAEHNESASVYVDYLSLITEWTAGNKDHVMDIIRHNYKLLVCLDSKDCLSRLFRQENYHKRILGRWLVGNAFFEQCIFER